MLSVTLSSLYSQCLIKTDSYRLICADEVRYADSISSGTRLYISSRNAYVTSPRSIFNLVEGYGQYFIKVTNNANSQKVAIGRQWINRIDSTSGNKALIYIKDINVTFTTTESYSAVVDSAISCFQRAVSSGLATLSDGDYGDVVVSGSGLVMTVDKPDLGLHNLADGDFSVVADSTALSLTNTRRVSLTTKTIDGWLSRLLQENNQITLRTSSTTKVSRIFVDTTGANFQFVNGANNASLRIGDSVAVRFNTSGSVGQVLTVTSVDGDGRMVINPKAGGSGTANCEQTLTKASHGFRKWTPIYWNGSTWARPAYDSIIPTYIVVDSTTANTFKVANCGNYSSTLTAGLYYYTGTSPGYSLTPTSIPTPIFEVAQSRLILQPLVGFQLAGGGGSGDVTRDELADSTAAIRADFPNGIISALPLGDVNINAKGNSLKLDSLDGYVNVAADKRWYVQKDEPGWAARFEPYQYLEYTANGDPRIVLRSFAGNDLDAPGETVQNLGSPRLGSFHFYGYKGGNWRRGASIAVYPDSVWSNFISGMMRFTTIAGGNGFNIAETIMSLSQRGHAMGPGIVKPDNDAAWQVDQSNKDTYYFNGSGRIYSKFRNTIFGIQDASVYSLVHNPFVDSTFFKGSGRFFGATTQTRFGKSEYTDVFGSTLETGLDISSRYNSSWASRFVANSYGYLDLINIENNGDNPRFNFYNSRGTSETTKTRSQPNDYVGFMMFAPYNGTAYHRGAVIGTTIAANSSAGSTRFSQTMFFGIDKAGNSPQISYNWLLALDTLRAYIPKNLQVGGLINGTTASLFVNSIVGGNVGINTVSPTSKLQIAGSVAFITTTISSATTLADHTIVFATGASTYLVTLPTASTCVGRKYIIKTNGGAKTISSYLDLTGSASTTLTNNTVLTIVSDGTNWQQL